MTSCSTRAAGSFFLACAATLPLHLPRAQEPPTGWKPRYQSLGAFCSHGLHGNDGDCGCENTQFRQANGSMYIMESVSTHPCERLFPAAAKGNSGACSYFRIRELQTGRVVANVSESLDHDFCSALADHGRDALWVFCSAFGRRSKSRPGPCQAGGGYAGCYVGAWKTRLSGNLDTWTPTARALTLPVGMGMANNDVTLVAGAASLATAAQPGTLPAHQAAMIIEGRGNWSRGRHYPEFAINIGADGDLSKNWQLLDAAGYRIAAPAGKRLTDGEGSGDAPTLRYDAGKGHYYSLGGGWITNGPARSRSLAVGSWEVSPLMPMAVPAARAKEHGLPPIDQIAGINTGLYTDIWKRVGGVPPTVSLFLENMTAWNWGVTDPDVCCSDGKAPSYMLHTLSQQGGVLPNGTKTWNMAALGTVNASLFEWLRGYFPSEQPQLKSDDRIMVALKPKREVRWYMPTGGQAFKDFNAAWLASPSRRAAMTGVYACCNFFVMNASGHVTVDSGGTYADRFEPWLSAGLTVHATGMVNEVAIKSGAALTAVPALAAFVLANKIHGIVVDYEPLDESQAHAQAYAAFLKALCTAVHALPGTRQREVGLNIADWTIIGPGYAKLYAAAGVDLMAVMTPTYSENRRNWPYVSSLAKSVPAKAIDMGVATSLQPSGPAGSQCKTAPFNATPFTDWASCNKTMSISDSCPYNASSLQAMLDFAATQGITKASVWRSDIDEECFHGTAPFYYEVLAKWIAVAQDEEMEHTVSISAIAVSPPPAVAADPGGSAGWADPPAAGGECSFSCAPGHASCPLTVPGDKCGYIYDAMTGNLADMIGRNGTAFAPNTKYLSRDLPSGALALLMSQCPQPGGCCAPSMAACVQPPPPPACDAAIALLRLHSPTPGTSFDGQAYPLLWHSFGSTCFKNGEGRDLVLGAINRSLPMSQAAATLQEFSYTNMYLMSTVNAILFGEIIQRELPDQKERADQSIAVGYEMLDAWLGYTGATGGLHEFTSPTYTYVQLSALYPGFLFAGRKGARRQFKMALDWIWADTAANTFPPRGALSGPHSRDYDQLLGHGMLYMEMFLWGLPGMAPLRCAVNDPHCEGPVEAAAPAYERPDGTSSAGTGEPMTVIAISWYNLLHPYGYRPPKKLRALATHPPTRVVTSRFLAQNVTANGLERKFAQLYNFVTPTFAIGSASQAYITNTHSKYYPNIEDKLVTILLGKTNTTPPWANRSGHKRESPQISLVRRVELPSHCLVPPSARAPI
jgi:hypothetical protein